MRENVSLNALLVETIGEYIAARNAAESGQYWPCAGTTAIITVDKVP